MRAYLAGARTPPPDTFRARFTSRGLDYAVHADVDEKRISSRWLAVSPQDGSAVWTTQLLAEKLVSLSYCDADSDETVRQILKKTRSSLGKKRKWRIPPEANADFVSHREDILDLYEQPYNKDFPVVCVDEKLKALVKEKLSGGRSVDVGVYRVIESPRRKPGPERPPLASA